MSKNSYNYDEILEHHLDTMIRLAFMQNEALEVEAILREVECEGLENIQADRDSAYQLFLNKLEKQIHADRIIRKNKTRGKTISRIIQIAACIVLAIGIATPIAIANVESIRVKVMELLIDIQEDHAELRLIENNDIVFFVPAEWQGEYYPSYIPGGFVLEEVGTLYTFARYSDKDGRIIRFTEYTSDDLVNVDSEDASTFYIEVNGEPALMFEKDDRRVITWGDGNKYFVLIADVPTEEALAIAESVRRT